MIPVPIPANWWDAFWLFFRVVTTFAFIAVMVWGLVVVRQMLLQIQSDRLERDVMLNQLKHTADDMAVQTQSILEKMDENTDLTRAGATAAKDAFHKANDANEKIAQTNTQLERVVSLRETEAIAHHVAESLEQIDKNTAQTAQNTRKK